MLIDGREKWLSIFRDLKNLGKKVIVNGSEIIEIEDYNINFNPNSEFLCSFSERKLNLKYNFTEFLWYLSGDRDDFRMENLSKFWVTIKNKTSPFYNSNYGYYFFAEGQVEYVIETLFKDEFSRQACIILNNHNVMSSDSKDKICTNAIMFRIRDNKLNMSVQMRSNDVITGLGIDCHMFCILYNIIFIYLKERYKDLQIGNYNHIASSFHIYKKHYNIMEQIVDNNGANYIYYNIPNICKVEECDFILENLSNINNNQINIPDNYNFSNYIYNIIKNG